MDQDTSLASLPLGRTQWFMGNNHIVHAVTTKGVMYVICENENGTGLLIANNEFQIVADSLDNDAIEIRFKGK